LDYAQDYLRAQTNEKYYYFTGNEIEINSGEPFCEFSGKDNHYKIQANEVTLNDAGIAFYLKDTCFVDDTINHNTFIFPETSTGVTGITYFGKDSFNFYDNNLYDYQDDVSEIANLLIVYANTDTIPLCHLGRNYMYNECGAGYGMAVGTEGSSASDGMVKDILIHENKIDARYTTTGETDGTYHGIFIGHQNNGIIRHNKVSGAPLGLVFKADGTNYQYTTGGAFGNVAINCLQSQLMKGIDGVKAYNNTYVSDRDNALGVYMLENIAGAQSDNSDLKNNIIYLTGDNSTAIHCSDSSYLGLSANHNNIYSTVAKLIYYDGMNKTFSETWKGKIMIPAGS
jgi:hypothetical protein